ncbi:DUF2680 domain-containing protein [[Clostridium] fimetarium]|uniref:DUF2680 domain-containing protein n=1 Tax=[Clostridium] fimetarium TaxID=99656 RepID=A0A1I0RTZ4_9FIRM|nr:DUF2680 domain-containing protein [[Clostridium] fimetarium]SEW44803.1 Protein of unknown function [[Clostridium] fimetarium]
MKKKKMIFIASVMLVAGIMSTSVFAASIYKSSDSTNLEEFKTEMLQTKEEILNEQVASGTITQEKADEVMKAIEENSVNCDGSGSDKIGQTYGAGFGSGNANGIKDGSGRGVGTRNGCNQGSCINQ